MCQYIDITSLTSNLPENINHLTNLTNHYNHPEIKIEVPICSADEAFIESGRIERIQSCTVLYNLPETYYLEFKGFATNIGMYTLSGVVKSDFFGYFHVVVHNSSLESLTIPPELTQGL